MHEQGFLFCFSDAARIYSSYVTLHEHDVTIACNGWDITCMWRISIKRLSLLEIPARFLVCLDTRTPSVATLVPSGKDFRTLGYTLTVSSQAEANSNDLVAFAKKEIDLPNPRTRSEMLLNSENPKVVDPYEPQEIQSSWSNNSVREKPMKSYLA
ncbi:hypothetical protein VNO77_07699 [Canavalia gladiata]|uniref:Uncharacterized protein n=1 Tax=Canavalia gladiata TaxID=3824 RepID=A0AAN9MBN2_CANGL